MSGGIRVSQTQNPATWYYTIDQNGNSMAYYPGIVDWLENVGVNGYNNVAAIQASIVPAVVNVIQTKGYYTEGDGGGGIYYRAGAAAAGSIQDASGAHFRLSLNDVYANPLQFGCKGDGVTNDRFALIQAMTTGLIVNGRGLTYAMAGQCNAPAQFKGMVNATFKWATTGAMQLQNFLFAITDLNNWMIDSLKFDLGNRQNSGSADDSTRGGLKVSSSNPGVLWLNDVSVSNVEAYGDGNGTRIYIRNVDGGFFDKLHARNGTCAFSPDPTNDCINGIDISQCRNVQIGTLHSHDYQVVLASVPTYQFSRAILFYELNNSTIGETLTYKCAQGVDYSGAIVAVTSPLGNNNVSWSAGVSYDCHDWCFKFANVAHTINASNLEAFNFGLGGFVFSSQSGGVVAGQGTAKIKLSNCSARNPSRIGANGFWALEQAGDVGYPRNVRLVGCESYEDNGNGFLADAFRNDVVYDGASKGFNEIVSCRGWGYTGNFNTGWVTYSCKVNGTSNLSLANASLSDIPWDAEVYDPAAMHSTTVQPQLIRPPIAGLWRVNATGYFAANATGIRKIDVLVNGAVVPGGSVTMQATTTDVAALSVSVDLKLLPTDTVRIQAYQNSGAALNFNRILSGLSISLIEAW